MHKDKIKQGNTMHAKKEAKHRVLSLFANIGVAEAYMEDLGFPVFVANEVMERRAKLYSQIYPNTDMVCGDINDAKIFNEIIKKSKEYKIDVVIATPPCQGMSTAGEQDSDDERNRLTLPAIDAIMALKPKYAMIENVPNYINTSIELDSERRLLVDIIKKKLEHNYNISFNIINTEDYGVPQSRTRVIILLSRRGQKIWEIPNKEECKVTMEDAIGWIPEIDPYVKDLTKEEFKHLFPHYEERKKRALEISPWNIPPVHVYRQVHAMQYTPTGMSAFDNPIQHRPIKKDGTLVKGYRNTYMRQRWDRPAYTITMDNRKISSQGNVHPGRYVGTDTEGEKIYSDPRTLTLYELMRIMSLPDNWPLPSNASEPFVRRIIGEGIPPLFMKKLLKGIE